MLQHRLIRKEGHVLGTNGTRIVRMDTEGYVRMDTGQVLEKGLIKCPYHIHGSCAILRQDTKNIFWDINTGKLLCELQGYWILTTDGKYAVYPGLSVRVWDLYANKLVREFSERIFYATDGRYILVDNAVYDIHSGQVCYKLPVVCKMARMQDSYLILVTEDTMQVCDLASGKIKHSFGGTHLLCEYIHTSPKYVLTQNTLSTHLWDICTGERLATWYKDKCLYVALTDNYVALWYSSENILVYCVRDRISHIFQVGTYLDFFWNDQDQLVVFNWFEVRVYQFWNPTQSAYGLSTFLRDGDRRILHKTKWVLG